MKILHVIPSYWPAFKFGGPIFSVHALNKELVKLGVQVNVCTTNAGLEATMSGDHQETVDGVDVTYHEYHSVLDFMNPSGYQLSRSLSRFLKKNIKEYDIVHITSIWNYPPAVAAHYCAANEKPYIVSPRGSLYPYTFSKKFWKKLPYYHLVAKRLIERAAAIHYTSADEQEQCHGYLTLKNKSFVVPNGIELSEYESNFEPAQTFAMKYPVARNKKLVLFLGRINWKKGVDILVRGFADVVSQRRDVHLMLAGNDDGDGYSKTVAGWIEQSGISEHVTLCGRVDGDQKLDAFRAADVFILPSYSENFGMAVVEALACGTPVIVSNKVGIAAQIEKYQAGTVVDTTAESIANGILSSLDTDKGNYSKNGKRLLREEFDIKKVARMMLRKYEELLSAGRDHGI